MRLIMLILAGLLATSSAGAQFGEFVEAFTYPDGAFPAGWVWTGDPQGGGQFLVQGEQFVHTSGGSVYYVRPSVWTSGQGTYEFDVYGSNWEFAWGIEGTPESGRCCRFYHDFDQWGMWAYTVTESNWSTLPGFPNGQYMFHNCTDYMIRGRLSNGPLVGWRHVWIEDALGAVTIQAEGGCYIRWPHPTGWQPNGIIGIGARAGSGESTPAFDNIEFRTYQCPVESRSWGAVKALFR